MAELQNIFAVSPDINTPIEQPKATTIDEQQARQDSPIGLGVTALKDVIAKDSALTDAQIEASRRNSTVLEQAQTAQDNYYNDVIKSYDNTQRILRLPPGIANFMGIFSSDWNLGVQKSNMEEAQVRSEQTTQRAQSQISINNQMPAIRKFELDEADRRLKAAGELIDFDIKEKDIDLKGMDMLLKKDQAAQERIKFALGSMSTAQVKAELVRANKGEGDFAGLSGFLEKRLQDEVQFEDLHKNALLDQAKKGQDLTEGNIRIARTRLEDMADKIPEAQKEALIQKAGNNAFIDIGGVQMPVTTLQGSLAKQADTVDKTRKLLLDHSNDQLNQDVQQNANMLRVLSKYDPRATSEFQMMVARRQQLDPNDLASVDRFHASVLAQRDRMKPVIDSLSKSFEGAESKEAVKQYFENGGQFSPQGATAVVTELAGNPAAGMRTMYSGAWTIINNEVYNRLAQQNIKGFIPASGTGGDMASGVAAALAGMQKDKNLKTVREEVMADPTIREKVNGLITSQRNGTAIVDVVKRLAGAQNAAPVWKQLAADPKLYRGEDGQPSLKALMNYTAARSVESQGKTDYSQLFVDAARNYGTTDGAAASTDPRYGLEDQALETHIYHSDPTRVIMQDFINMTQGAAAIAKSDIDQRIQEDIAAEKQRQSTLQVAPSLAGNPALASKPSNTGARLNQSEIFTMYGK